MSFKDKVAIVTGSSSGIGQSVVLMLAKQGAIVVVHGMNEERINVRLECVIKIRLF
jgi:NAD(P)-dependent dehydrogenase (short-subunit alcohol dehydrogenase family)